MLFNNCSYFSNKPRALHGRDALLHTDLLRYKQPGSFDDTDTDDAISLGDSTIAASDRMRTIELEQELAKIKDVGILLNWASSMFLVLEYEQRVWSENCGNAEHYQ